MQSIINMITGENMEEIWQLPLFSFKVVNRKLNLEMKEIK
jgi:hypothetical protein